MSQKSKVILGTLAAAASLGALLVAGGQAASGQNLAYRFQALAEPAGAPGINRTAKADRQANVPQAAEPGHTIMLKVDSLADTSVLVRIPTQKEARNLTSGPAAVKPAGRKGKMAYACEPPVSVLTEVAKLLQPGRCVT